MGPTVEMTVEQQILSELRLLKNELLGREGAEEHGRLPRVERAQEATSKDHETRLSSLEDDRIRWKAYAVAAAFLGSMLGSCMGLMIALAKLLK